MKRTNTTNLTSFTLPLPHAATFDFTSAPNSSSTIRIAIPPSSSWRMPLHWHPSYARSSTSSGSATIPCRCVTVVKGHISITPSKQGNIGGGTISGGTGLDVQLAPDDRVVWRRRHGDNEVLIVDLIADYTLWRNICSATIDRDIFPQLASTPYWFKALFIILAPILRYRVTLLDLILYIQMQMIFYTHDFYVYHGTIEFHSLWLLPWIFRQAPPWVDRLELQIAYIITRVVMATAYWIGKLFLGMKGEYSEYTPRESVSYEKKEL